ncbi:MAG: alkaline phosphatase family protein [Candidatus Woesearchaeota archaeon]
MFRLIFVVLLSLSIIGCVPQQVPEHIFLITIDGARPDIVQSTYTPNMDILISNYGAGYSFNSTTICPSMTPPTHASLFTGVLPWVHGYYYPGDTLRTKTIFELFEENGYSTALVDGKGGRIKGLERGVSFYRGEINHYALFEKGDIYVDDKVMSLLIEIFEYKRPTLSFVLLPAVDYAGHLFGHESLEYSSAIFYADFAIGSLIQYLKDNSLWEKSAIIIVADHGMTGFSHGNCYPTDMAIPIIKYGSFFDRGEIAPQSILDIPLEILDLYGISSK